MSDRIEKAARVIGDAIGVDPDIPSGAMYVDPTEIARALDEAGMLAPVPLREEWQARVTYKNRHGQTITQTGRGSDRECAIADATPPGGGLDLVNIDAHRRLVTGWEAAP